MTESRTDTLDAAKTGIRLLLIAVLVGLVSGLAAWLFIVGEHYTVNFLWHWLPANAPGVPVALVNVLVVAAMTALAALVIVLVGKRPFDMGHAAAEFDTHGRMDTAHLVSGTAYALLSLFSGAAIGPEGALTDISGGLGTLLADRLRLDRDSIKTMAYAGVAGAFAAFFGAAPVGALLAAELISPTSPAISRTTIVAGLGAGSSAWIVYSVLGGPQLAPIFSLPGGARMGFMDLGFGLALGLAGSVIGLVYGAGMMKTRSALAGLRTKPWLAALAGGAVTALAAVMSPYLLFSGQAEIAPLLERAATLGVIVLVGLGLGKLALSVWSVSTVYFGGPIFPLIFAGTCFGLALNLAMPVIPQHVAIVAIVAGMGVAATAAPLSVAIFLSLIADPQLISVITIACVAAFVVRQAVAPTLPGIYRNAKTDARS